MVLAKVIDLSRGVHVYSNLKDLLLSLGSKINQWRTLGLYGSGQFDDLAKSVHWVDCTHVADNDLFDTGHAYNRISPQVVDDIRRLLAGQAPPNRKRILLPAA